MKHEKDIVKKVWFYNDRTGSLVRKSVRFRVNEVESWYEDPKGWPTYDPFYIDEDRNELAARMSRSLNAKLMETFTNIEKLIKLLKKLQKV